MNIGTLLRVAITTVSIYAVWRGGRRFERQQQIDNSLLAARSYISSGVGNGTAIVRQLRALSETGLYDAVQQTSLLYAISELEAHMAQSN